MAQRIEPAPVRESGPSDLRSLTPGLSFAPQPIGPGWLQPVASLLVPGTGQLLARRDRGLAYLAAELWIVARAVALDREGRRARARYREMAYEVARRRFGVQRRDGPFEYYEHMGQYVESGRYDSDPGPSFAPESDTTTFNGSIWRLAQRTFFADPDSAPDPASAPYLAALSFYQARAVPPEFQWSWRDARLEQDVYRATIRESDEAFRSSTNYLGAVIMNHLVSAIDALVTRRLSTRRVVPRVSAAGNGGVALRWRLGIAQFAR